MSKKHTFIFAGRSGCGKGTQVNLLKEYISKKYEGDNIFHYYSGDGFRAFMKEENYSSSLSKEISKVGGLQPNFLAVWLWASAFVDNLKGDEHIFIDGSPRALIEAESLDSAIKFYKREKPTVIVLNVSRETSKERLLARKREDDTLDSIENRLNWYETDVMPTVDFYRNNPDYNVVEVDGEKSIEEVHQEIVDKLSLE